VRDKLRELLYPALVLSIVGSLWVAGYARDMEETAGRAEPPSPELVRIMRKIERQQRQERLDALRGAEAPSRQRTAGVEFRR
jgi:hypothetical protein